MYYLKIISHLHPTALVPYQGKFVRDQIELLNKSLKDTIVSATVPTPYSIPCTLRDKKNSSPFIFNSVKPKRIKYLSFPKKRFLNIIKISLANRIKSIIDEAPIDIAHIHFLYPSGIIIPYLKQKKIKSVLTIHGSDFYRSKNKPFLIPIVKEVFDAVDIILSVGPQLCNHICEFFPQHINKVHHINNFVDEDVYIIPTKTIKTTAQLDLGWDPNKLNFVSVTRNVPEKGFDILVSLINRLSDLEHKIKFNIIGNINESLIRTKAKSNPMINLIPPVAPQELLRYYHASDIYISSSRREGFGLAMIEAAATGLPLISTPTGIASSFITEEIGLLSSNFESDSLEKKIRELVSTFEFYDSYKISSKTVKHFGKRVFVENISQIYQRLLMK